MTCNIIFLVHISSEPCPRSCTKWSLYDNGHHFKVTSGNLKGRRSLTTLLNGCFNFNIHLLKDDPLLCPIQADDLQRILDVCIFLVHRAYTLTLENGMAPLVYF